MARAPDEADIQRAVCIWLDGNPDGAGVPRVKPALIPGVVYWHTPNSGEGRNAFQGKILKQQGVKAGVHDLLFLWGGLYGLEMKKPGGILSSAQIRMHAAMLSAGMVASATVDGIELAKQTLRLWGLATVDIQR